MVALIFLFVNLAASLFKSKGRLEAENAPAPAGYTPSNSTTTTSALECARSVFVGPGVRRDDGLLLLVRRWGVVGPPLRQHGLAAECVRAHATRRTGSCTRHRTANCGPQRQHQPRDRGGLRHPSARPGRRSIRSCRRVPQQPARPICYADGAPWGSLG